VLLWESGLLNKTTKGRKNIGPPPPQRHESATEWH